MNRSRIFIALSVIGVLITFGLILKKKIPPEELTLFFQDGTIPATFVPQSREIVSLDEVEETAEIDKTLPAVGQEVGGWQSLLEHTRLIPRLSSIPWERSDIEQALRNFRAGECRLMPPDSEIFPFPENIGTADDPVMSFRKSAVVVGLKVDPQAQKSLPKASKGAIEGYLASHALVVEASVYQNRSRNVTFAGPVLAGLVSKTSQGRSVQEEPMIRDAVGNIRLLGVLSDPDQPDDLVARTLVLAFAYDRVVAEGLSSRRDSVQDYELLFIHLLSDDLQIEAEPQLVAFATTDGRTKFQEIEINSSNQVSPNISAAIKFNEFRVMGLYPAKPTVTAVTCRARSSTPLEQVMGRLRGQNGIAPVSLVKYLDELHSSVVKTGRLR